MNFEQAFQKTVWEWEGGDRVHTVPGDPGGTTKYGIAQRSHPTVDVPNLTEDEAKLLYRHNYWSPLRVQWLRPELRWDVFDFGVNAGVGRSAETLQQAINLCRAARGQPTIEVDGRIGPQTAAAANGLPTARLLRVFRAVRAEHYLKLADRGMAKFLEGWLGRAYDDRSAYWLEAEFEPPPNKATVRES